MRIDIITCVPTLLESPFAHSMVKIAQEKNCAEIHIHDLREYGQGNYRRIDDAPFGGEAGMVMMIEPIDKCIADLKKDRTYDAVVYMTPDGKRLEQGVVNQFSLLENIIILCGHYKGVDQRVRDAFITHEISIGDYVLSGGELGAAVLTDAIVRLIPGVLSDETSALTDSFQDGLLAPPVYTRPAEYKEMSVPEILLGGNHKLIDEWKQEQAIARTKERRPDLFNKLVK
jgi:tRNA (guanine37-N1)-methyltransferase